MPQNQQSLLNHNITMYECDGYYERKHCILKRVLLQYRMEKIDAVYIRKKYSPCYEPVRLYDGSVGNSRDNDIAKRNGITAGNDHDRYLN